MEFVLTCVHDLAYIALKLDAMKSGMVLYDSFYNNYVTLGEVVGKAWGGRKKIFLIG